MTRNEVIKSVTEGASHKCFRGDSVWCVKDGAIFYYNIRMFDKDENPKNNVNAWGYSQGEGTKEGEFTEDNCPLIYLDFAPKVIDHEWRERVRGYRAKIQAVREEITHAFLSCPEDKCVEVTLERPGYRIKPDVLIVEEVVSHFEGRQKESPQALFNIRPHLVKSVKIVTL